MKYEFSNYKPQEILTGHIKAGGTNNKGGSIGVNSLFFERDNKPWIGVMGEYHFQRDNKENWRKELLKMKAGGVSIIATYLLWIYIEEEEGVWNFEGDNDLRAFLEEVKKAGLDLVLRVGPWAHGECRNGGFPDWLVKKDFKLRDNTPQYMAYVTEWFEKIYENCHEFFYKDGGPIIAMQLENELVDNAEHILELKKLAIKTGFDLPMYTATGWNARFGAKLPLDEVLPVFGAYADAPWSDKVSELPLSAHYAFHTERNDTGIGVDLLKEKSTDGWSLPYERYPYATCEIGPGMQSTHHRRVIMAGIDAYAMSLVKLGCGNNLIGYYMYHGGINKLGKLSTFNEDKATGYPNEYAHIGYDFGTCISSYGEIREQYRLLNLLHLFVNDFGEILAPMQTVAASEFVDENNDKDLRYCMRTDGNGAFIFVNNYQRHGNTSAHKEVSFDVLGAEVGPVNVAKEDAFILPVNIYLGMEKLSFATAQLLCKEDNTYYFMKIKDNNARFVFADGTDLICNDTMKKGDICIKVIDTEKARFVRKLSGKVVEASTDVYEDDGKIVEITKKDAKFSLTPCEAVPLNLYEYEMSIDGKRKLSFEKLSTDTDEGFITILRDDYDVAQIYADGKLVADNFNEFINWRVPASLVYKKDCYLVMSELRDDYYINKDDILRVSKER